jgi:hypothetical protein
MLRVLTRDSTLPIRSRHNDMDTGRYRAVVQDSTLLIVDAGAAPYIWKDAKSLRQGFRRHIATPASNKTIVANSAELKVPVL